MMTKEGDTRLNIAYIVVDSIAGVQFRLGLYNSFLTQTPGFKGVYNMYLAYVSFHLVCMRDRCGKMAADSELTKQLCHMTLLFTQKFTQKFYKILQNSE